MTPHLIRPDWYGDGSPNPLTATGNTLRWGVVSTGNIARTVTADLALLADAELYAVSSRSATHAEAFAQEFGFTTWHGDTDSAIGYQRLLADPAVDVVYIGTPHGSHFEIASAALAAGKHVLCEKALTINAAEAAELIELAKTHGVFLMEAVWARFVPGIQRAAAVFASGELGQIRWVQSDLGFPAPMDTSSRLWAVADGGGALLDLTVYPLTWALAALGFPDAVQANAQLTDWGVDSQNALTLSYSGGAHAQLMSSLLAQCRRGATVCGSEGILEVSGSTNNPKELHVRSGWKNGGYTEQRIEAIDVIGTGYTYELREVTRCIQQGRSESPTMPWQDSLDVMRLFDGVRHQIGVSYPNDSRG